MAIYEDGFIRRVLLPGESISADVAYTDDSLSFAVQTAEYFQGSRKIFTLPFFIPGTIFKQDVYRTVLHIPYGQTATYSAVAFAAGYPHAMRAVGNAMKSNPLPLIIPCHRVIHQSKNQCRYRGGANMKRYLLSLEKENR
ncbi:MAG: methylated-DNA--[protein]-cysteine S-methyltransferase [Christensenellales bacterium]